MTSRLVLMLAAVIVVAACSAEVRESVEPVHPPTGCLGLDARDCAFVADAVEATIGGDLSEVTYLQIGPFFCGVNACPPGLAARPSGHITIEFAGREPKLLSAEVANGVVDLAPRGDPFLIAVTPASARLTGISAPYELQHCGIFSGIDVDGSFWDPVGVVDAENNDAINGADGIFTLTSRGTATLRTRGGLSLDLIRHQGVKHLAACM
jgi:hypothetical protein